MTGTVRLLEWLEKHEQGSLGTVGSRSGGEGAVSFTHAPLPCPSSKQPGTGTWGGTENHKLIAKVLVLRRGERMHREEGR